MVQKWAPVASNEELAAAYGVRVSLCTSFHTNKTKDNSVKSKKMDLVRANNIPGFHWDLANVISKYDANVKSHGGLAYEHIGPVIDADVAMPSLVRLAIEPHLLRTYNASAIVNATGSPSLETASDESVYPLRGAVLRVINDGSDFPRVNNSFLVSTESKSDGNFKDMAFTVPRNDNILILRSITQPNQWKFDLTPESPEIKDMRKRCEDLLPFLKNAKLDPKDPLSQGARPYRKGNVRVEREQGGKKRYPSRIVHAYGHGAASSLAFGSGRECLRIVEEIHAELENGFEVSARL